MSPCNGCHAGCCRSFAVPLTGADILRIERARGLSFWDFACRWEDRAGLISHGLVPQLFFPDEPATPFVICLRQDASRLFPNSTKCRFLVEESPTSDSPLGKAQCSIHGVHPSACRIYPTRLNETGQLAVLYDVPEYAPGLSSRPEHRLCSRPWQTADIDPVAGIQELIVTQFEMQFFHQVAAKWNQRPAEWELFPEFVRLVYEGRVIREVVEDPVTIPFPGVHDVARREHRYAA